MPEGVRGVEHTQDGGAPAGSGAQQDRRPTGLGPRLPHRGDQAGGLDLDRPLDQPAPPGGTLKALTKGTHYFDVNFQRGWQWYSLVVRRAQQRGADHWEEASPYHMFHPAGDGADRSGPAGRPPDRQPAGAGGARVVPPPVRDAAGVSRTRPFAEAIELESERVRGEEEKIRANPRYERPTPTDTSPTSSAATTPSRLERIHSLFSPEQVLVMRSESMFTDPRGELARVWSAPWAPARPPGRAGPLQGHPCAARHPPGTSRASHGVLPPLERAARATARGWLHLERTTDKEDRAWRSLTTSGPRGAGSL